MAWEIKLTKGYVAIVDEWNYEWLNVDVWHYHTYYAARVITLLDADYPRCQDREIILVMMHRQIMNPPAHMEIDHINHNKLDNREANLRICTHAENQWNTHKRSGCSSPYKGVSWNNVANYWQAHIVANGKHKHLGCWDNEIEAALSWDAAAKEIHGEFAVLNFPNE